MSFYRYALTTPESYTRSLTAINDEVTRQKYFAYSYYTSLSEKPSVCRVMSVGHEVSWPHKTYKRRVDNRFNIRYVLDGTVYINGTAVPAGHFFTSMPYEDDVIENFAESAEYYHISIGGDGTEAVIKNAGFLSVPTVQVCPFIDKIPPLLHEALYGSHEGKDSDLYLMAVFMYLMSLHKPYNEGINDYKKSASRVYYEQAVTFINTYFREGIAPSDVADFLHLSPSYLRRIFLKHGECSLQEYIIKKRIGFAETKLATDKCSVTEAAEAVGYFDYALFSKMFKKYVGVSPREYKRRDTDRVNEKRENEITD